MPVKVEANNTLSKPSTNAAFVNTLAVHSILVQMCQKPPELTCGTCWKHASRREVLVNLKILFFSPL